MKTILAILMFLGVNAQAQLTTVSGTATDSQKLRSWLATQDLRAGTLLDLNSDFHAVVYVKGLSLGQKGLGLGSRDAKAYLDAVGGGSFTPGERPRVLLAFLAHPANIAESLYLKLPFKDRVSLSPLPDIEIGPAVFLPMPGATWRLKESIGLVAALGF